MCIIKNILRKFVNSCYHRWFIILVGYRQGGLLVAGGETVWVNSPWSEGPIDRLDGIVQKTKNNR